MTFPVSVQIITLNEEANIAECIESVLRNDPAEVVVIDGGSTDRTVEMAKSLGATVLAPGRLGRGPMLLQPPWQRKVAPPALRPRPCVKFVDLAFICRSMISARAIHR